MIDPVSATTKAVGGIVGKVADTIDELHTSEEELAKIELEQSKLTHENNVKQIDLNKQDAKHSSLFISGWRPFLGWGLVVILFSQLALIPYLISILSIWDIDIREAKIDLNIIMQLLYGILGIAGLRTAEKKWGVDTKSIDIRNKVAKMDESTLNKEIVKWER